MVKQTRNAIAIPEGKTRICLDPWAKVFIRSTCEVCLCCNAPPVGKLDNTNTIEDILNGSKAKEYRKGLIGGEPLSACVTCPDRPIGDPEQLIELVYEFLQTGEVRVP